MVELSVNVDHVATLRETRKTYEPDPVWAAVAAHLGGASGITVHLREDRRHIQEEDLYRLRSATQVRFNLEMAATEEMLRFAEVVRPDRVTLVPEKRLELTTEGGLDICAQFSFLKDFLLALKSLDIPTSVFIDPDKAQVEAAKVIGASMCELHTGVYANVFHRKDASHPLVIQSIHQLKEASDLVHSLGMRVHAGHALNYYNVKQVVACLPHLHELHIGHSIVSRALFVGFESAVREMFDCIKQSCCH